MSEECFKIAGRWYSAMDFLWVQNDAGGWDLFWYWRARRDALEKAGQSPWIAWLAPVPPVIEALKPREAAA